MVLSEDQEVTREAINLETATISWKELEVYYAGGNVISVSPELDLIDVALVITNDDSEQLKTWTTQKLIDSVTDEQAKHSTKPKPASGQLSSNPGY